MNAGDLRWLTAALLALACGGASRGAEPGNAAGSAGLGVAGATVDSAGTSSNVAGVGAATNAGGDGTMANAGDAGTATNAGGAGTSTNAGQGGAGGNAGGAPFSAGGAAGRATAGAATAGAGSEPIPLTDVNTLGQGPCAGTTLASVIAAVHTQHPELAEVTDLHDPNTSGESESIEAFTSTGGYRLVFYRGFGDCPSGCINREYFYFETDQSCAPNAAGDYHVIYDSGQNCMRVVGEPLWDIPSAEAQVSDCSTDTALPPGFNDDCLENECPLALVPTTFVGVQGEQCVCAISCLDDPSVCPAGTTCSKDVPDLPVTICTR